MTETGMVDFSDVRWGSVEWTNLCTLYLRTYESRSPAPILGDTAAAEAVDRIEYDWARMRRAMRPRAGRGCGGGQDVGFPSVQWVARSSQCGAYVRHMWCESV